MFKSLVSLFRSFPLGLYLLCFLALFFYLFRLDQTLIFASDFLRDTLRALELWQNKEFTFLGSPLSFTTLPQQKIYFTSLSLYLGMLGLPLTKGDPIGVIYPNTFFFLLSLPFCYFLMLRLFTNDRLKAIFATFLYALSPLTVFHARFFWTPNLLIPFSVFFWFFSTTSRGSFRFFAGFLGAIMFLLHYMAIFPLCIYYLVLGLGRKFKSLTAHVLGTVLGLSPFLLFELRNQFFISKSFLFRLQDQSLSTGAVDETNFLYKLTLFPATLLGFRSADLSYPTFLMSPLLLLIFSLVFLLFSSLIVRKLTRSSLSRLYLFTLLLGIAWAILTKSTINTRYLFFLYPLFIWFVTHFLLALRPRFLVLLILFIMLGTSILHITRTQTLTPYVMPLDLVERVAASIIADSPGGRYNLTENVTGDAQALAIRYFLLKDSPVKPQLATDYYHLDMLYVIAPNLDVVYAANRWEFRGTNNLELVDSWPVAPLNVYKYYPNRTK